MQQDLYLQRIFRDEHAADALDLATRAQDYVILEVGHAPEAEYVKDFFTAVPPGLSPDRLLHFGVMDGPALVGLLCIAQGYEFADDWWIGLMLLDPAFRGQGIGGGIIHEIKLRARAQGMATLKLAVLTANPRGLAFWRRHGFEHHRDAPATPESDGHDRVVLKYTL
ncbi:MAG: GNAT family N-acetyltransferase [Pseudomonadota bacterium]